MTFCRQGKAPAEPSSQRTLHILHGSAGASPYQTKNFSPLLSFRRSEAGDRPVKSIATLAGFDFRVDDIAAVGVNGNLGNLFGVRVSHVNEPGELVILLLNFPFLGDATGLFQGDACGFIFFDFRLFLQIGAGCQTKSRDQTYDTVNLHNSCNGNTSGPVMQPYKCKIRHKFFCEPPKTLASQLLTWKYQGISVIYKVTNQFLWHT